jgi:hypothetical protein
VLSAYINIHGTKNRPLNMWIRRIKRETVRKGTSARVMAGPSVAAETLTGFVG